MDDGLESRIELLVTQAMEAARADRIDVRRSRVGADPLIVIELVRPHPHRLTLRVQEGGVLLDIDNSQAMEFADDDLVDLGHVLRTYCRGELEVQVRVRDGRYHALRTSAGQLSFQGSVVGLFRSGRKEWRRIG